MASPRDGKYVQECLDKHASCPMGENGIDNLVVPFDTDNRLFRLPRGLAVGLALKESRYAGIASDTPRGADAPLGSPFPERSALDDSAQLLLGH